jgi:hypothetical protein
MKHINNFESYLILENILSLIPLNESSEKEVSKSTFSKVLDKVKEYSKKGLVTTALLISLLGSANFTQAQKAQLGQVAKIENQAVNNNDQGLIMVTATAKNSKSTEFFVIKWEIKVEKNQGEVDPSSENAYVGYISIQNNKHMSVNGVRIDSEPKSVIRSPENKEGKKSVQNKLIKFSKEIIEKHVNSKLDWVSYDGVNFSANYTY